MSSPPKPPALSLLRSLTFQKTPRQFRKAAQQWLSAAGFCALSLAACQSSKDDTGGSPSGDGDGDSSPGDGDGDIPGTGGISGDGDIVVAPSGGNSGDGDGLGGSGPVCESASSEAKLSPVFLAFAFDVSGSMGKYDHPNWWHDPAAKWIPVRQATSAFFEDASSNGISASMTFFPADDDVCESDTYLTPDVAMTALPSSDFSSALDDYEAEVGMPLSGGDWRGNTPTLAAFLGTSEYLAAFQANNTEAKTAVVLVTDGLPQGCKAEDNQVAAVSAAVAALLETGIRTYVIGIENPTVPPAELPEDWDDWGCDDEPCAPPNTLDALHEVANAGGTVEAFLIDTGDPAATQATLRQAIDAIRSQSISCELGIPPNPNGGTFDPDRIDVTYTVEGTTMRFNFDPTCQEPGSWHYDDDTNPSSIQLCADACDLIQSLPGAQLDVAFLCEDRPDVVR